MRVFFSGTDLNTLQKEGLDCNNFVSLIVNNAGDYIAKITRKVISVKKCSNTYLDDNSIEDTEEVEEYVKSYDLSIKFEKEFKPNTNILNRIEELKKKQYQTIPVTKDLFSEYESKALKSIYKDDFEDKSKDYKDLNKDKDYNDLIGKLSRSIISLNLLNILEESKVNDWLRVMETKIDKSFDSLYEFESVLSSFIDLLLERDEIVFGYGEEDNDNDNDYYNNIINSIINKIESYSKIKSNKYLECIIRVLEGCYV